MGSDTDPDDARRLPVRPPKPGTAMSVFVLLVGIGIVGVGAYTYAGQSAALENRVEVSAEITDTGVEKVPVRGTDEYAPTVTYQYRYRGTDYTSSGIYPGGARPKYESRASAQSRASAYVVGERVTAYVDPDAPSNAYLEDSRSGHGVGSFVAGVFVSLIGGLGLYQARRESRARGRLS